MRSLDRYVVRSDGVVQFKQGKPICKMLNDDGYYHIHLCKDGDCKTVRVHRLVAEAFIANPEGLSEVNHIDADRTNNQCDNLEWCDHKYNVQYAIELGNHVCTKDLTGKNNPNYGNHKLSDVYRNNPELAKEKLRRPNGQNGRSIKVALYDKDNRFIEIFEWIGGCAKYLIDCGYTANKIESLRGKIREAMNNGNLYLNHYYKSVK